MIALSLSMSLCQSGEAKPAAKGSGSQGGTGVDGRRLALFDKSGDKKEAKDKEPKKEPEKAKKGLFGMGKNQKAKAPKSKPQGDTDSDSKSDTKSDSKSDDDRPPEKDARPGDDREVKESEPSARAEKTETPAPRTETNQSTAGKAETPAAAEPLSADPALISVLRDLSKSLKDSEEAAKVEDPCQKAALSVAQLALAKAVGDADLASNRILKGEDKIKLDKAMATEAWASGDIAVSSNCHASLSAVWAKKVDGLVNVAIAGNCNCKAAPAGDKVGQFVFVLNGRSAVDTGFDIQSQADVNYWLGKLTTLNVDTSCCDAAALGVSEKSQSSILVLKAVLTDRSRQYLAQTEEARKRQIALNAENERKAADARARSEAELKARVEADLKSKAEAELKAKIEAELKAKQEAKAEAELKAREAEATAQKEAEARAAAQAEANQSGVRSIQQSIAMSAQSRGWDSPPPPPPAKTPSPSAQLVCPEKAVAGQYLTAAVVNQRRAPETEVQISFNGSALATGQDGKALYMVPEDAIPGPTLSVALPGKPDHFPQTVYVQQPIQTPSEQRIPRVDRVSPVVENGGNITIDGHSFEGVANSNSVVIDGQFDARVMVASPVQIKADIPSGLLVGPHSVSISAAGGLRSNPGQFEVVNIEVEPIPLDSPKDVIKKFAIRVNGTKASVRLRIRNLTPDVVRVGKLNDFKMLTPGGANNVVVVDGQRLRPGVFHIETSIDQSVL